MNDYDEIMKIFMEEVGAYLKNRLKQFEFDVKFSSQDSTGYSIIHGIAQNFAPFGAVIIIIHRSGAMPFGNFGPGSIIIDNVNNLFHITDPDILEKIGNILYHKFATWGSAG